MTLFNRRLAEEIENLEPSLNNSHLEAARASNSALREAEAALDGLRQNLARAVESINADLAVAVRNLLPKVNVSLSNGKCNITYKSQSLSMRPDLDRGKWTVEQNDSGKAFSRQYLQYLNLNEDPAELSEAIGDYLVGQYKTLQDVKFKQPVNNQQPAPSTPPNIAAEARPILKKGTQEPGTQYFA